MMLCWDCLIRADLRPRGKDGVPLRMGNAYAVFGKSGIGWIQLLKWQWEWLSSRVPGIWKSTETRLEAKSRSCPDGSSVMKSQGLIQNSLGLLLKAEGQVPLEGNFPSGGGGGEGRGERGEKEA